MKKLALTLSLLLAVSISAAFGFGVGLQLNGNASDVFEPGVAVTFKLDQCPLYFAGNYYVGDGYTSIGMTGDYWALNKELTDLGGNALKWFIGVGFFTNMVFDDPFGLNAGLRVPIGLNMLFNDFFEPYLQVAPSFGLTFVPSIGATNLFFPISAGFRLWFHK